MSRKSKPILIVTSVKSDASGAKYITSAHLTNGIALHHVCGDYIFGRRAYVKDMETKYKLKYKLFEAK